MFQEGSCNSVLVISHCEVSRREERRPFGTWCANLLRSTACFASAVRQAVNVPGNTLSNNWRLSTGRDLCRYALSVGTWRLVDYGRLLRDECALLPEARHWNVRILLLLDKLALVSLLTKGRKLSFPVHAVTRRTYGIAHRANCFFCFFRWVPSEVNCIDRVSKFLLSRWRVLQQQSMSSLAPLA